MQHPGEIVHLLSLFARFADVWEASSTRIFTIVAEGQRVWELVMQTWVFRSYSGLCKLFSAH